MNATKASAIQKHLSKEEAKQILEVEGYKNVVIGAVIHGTVGLLGGDNAAFVIAMGTHPDIYHYSPSGEIQRTFAFDEQLGWFTWVFEEDRKTGGKSKLHICTKKWKADDHELIRTYRRQNNLMAK